MEDRIEALERKVVELEAELVERTRKLAVVLGREGGTAAAYQNAVLAILAQALPNPELTTIVRDYIARGEAINNGSSENEEYVAGYEQGQAAILAHVDPENFRQRRG